MAKLQRVLAFSVFLFLTVRAQTCNTDTDCNDRQCCEPQLRGKRQITGSGLCKARPGLNEDCFVNFGCRCLGSLECVADGRSTVPQGPKGKCEQPIRLCKSNYECNRRDECCEPQVKGKRALNVSGGVCTRRPGLGQSCFVTFGCRCRRGLRCVGNGQRVVPQGELGTCQKPPPRTCKSDRNCHRHRECCQPQVKGKRSLNVGGGVCTRRPTLGKGCFVTFGCRCRAGLQCVGNGKFVTPQGQLGTCKFQPRGGKY